MHDHLSSDWITETIKFLTWLKTVHGRTVASYVQADVDAWLADGPTTRHAIRTFFVWAVKNLTCHVASRPNMRIGYCNGPTSPRNWETGPDPITDSGRTSPRPPWVSLSAVPLDQRQGPTSCRARLLRTIQRPESSGGPRLQPDPYSTEQLP